MAYKRAEWINRAPAQYQDILEKHDMWMKDIEGGERADLCEADLHGADLRGANLRWVIMRGANLREADLRWADMYWTDLRGADMRGANLRWAIMHEVDMRRADIDGADIDGADLGEVFLHEADLGFIKKDMFDVLSKAIPEIPFLKKMIIEGKIDGLAYNGECACLCGTIEKSGRFGKKCDMRDPYRPIERFFSAIKPEDTPENSQFSKLALEWIEEFEKTLEKE